MARKQKQLLSGNEALALGARDFGVKVASAYPGTPSTEILQNLSKFKEIYSEWAPNEKVALEVAVGASLGGARTLATMKHVGLNVAADPFFTASYIGVKGGLVLVCADDPGMHSSQNEQDNRHYARAAKVPMLEPADSQEAYDFMGQALEISEAYDTPVMIRVTTRVCHAKGLVQQQAKHRVKGRKPGFEKNTAKNVMVPNFARLRHEVVEERTTALKALSDSTPLNRVEKGNRDMGIITSGVAYQYAREAFPEAVILKLGLTYPLPEKKIRTFARGVKKLVVVEELDPYMEDAVRAMGISVSAGKNRLPICGELSPEVVRDGLSARRKKRKAAPEAIPPRPPALCPGCPHSATLYTVKKLKLNVMGDIGCYTLSVAPPLEAMDACLCMGASIGMAHGMSKALGPEAGKRFVAVLGDSTFLHSGITSLMNVAYNRGISTVLVLDNRTTAMTGFQDHAATGRTLMGDPAPEVDLEALGKALGITSVRVADPYDLKSFRKLLKEEVEADHSSMVIARRECLLLKKGEKRNPRQVDPETCTGCNMCLQTGCPAISLTPEGKARIDAVVCNGCPICQQVCKAGAIHEAT